MLRVAGNAGGPFARYCWLMGISEAGWWGARRNRNPVRLAATGGLLLAALSGCGASASRHAPAPQRRRGAPISAPRCPVRVLRLALTKPISPATDERGREFALVNTSDRACTLSVSPRRIVLYDHGRRMPFHYGYDLRRGGSLEVPARRLRPVLLLPSTAGYFSATKAGCVGKGSGVATELRVFLPGSPTPLKIAFPNDGGYGVSVISYCLPEGGVSPHRTPGNKVYVSPIERRPPACIREPENPNETEHESERRNRECEAQQNATWQSYQTTGTGKPPAWEEE